MKNFVTYTNAEIKPGPQLNVIIGPNGTGKSTLVCAMVLGLGGKPAVLGRAKEPRDFIKHGEDEALIETELYGGQGKQNCIIKRKIFQDNTSKWWMNGHDCGAREVLNFVKNLNIQVGNLCQFLPQDRVASFAAMDPKELLHETEMAINDEMEKVHKELIELKKQETSARSDFEQQAKVLSDLEKEHADMDRDVRRFKERETMADRKKFMELKRPWVAYEIRRQEAVQLKEARDKLEQEKREAEEVLAPLQEEVAQKQRACQEGTQDETRLVTEGRTINTQRAQLVEQIGTQAEKTVQLEQRLVKLEQTEEKRAKREQNIRKNIADTEAKIARAESAEAERLARLEKWQGVVDELKGEEGPLAKEVSELGTKSAQLHQSYQEKGRHLQTVSGFKNRLLAQIKALEDSHVYDVYMWVHSDEAKAKLRGKVYGPIYMEVSLKDKMHCVWLDKILPFSEGTGFYTEYMEDRQAIIDYQNKQKWKQVRITWAGHAGEEHRRPLSKEQMKQFGFSCYLDELFDAPELVKWTLCNQHSLHQVPICFDNTADAHLEALRDLVRTSNAVKKFMTASNFYAFKASAYSNEVLTSVEQLKTVLKFLTPSPLDEVDKLQREIEEVKAQGMAVQEEHRRAKEKLGALTEKLKQAQREIQGAKQEDIRGLKVTLKTLERDLVDASSSAADERDNLQRAIAKSLRDRIAPLTKLQALTPKWMDIQTTLAQALLKRGYLQRQAEEAKERLNTATQANADIEQRFKEAQRLFDAARDDTRSLRDHAKKNAPRPPELEAIWEELPNTLEELDEAIQNLALRIQSMALPQGLMDRFKELEAKIAKMCDEQENHEQNLREKQERIVTLREKWLPDVHDFVQQIDANFSEFFKQINCTGSVKLNAEGDDFANFGIDIWVSYRKEDPPRKLDARVQSGGERSVATMLYLIALQQLSDCPFRLVDEINQGMDPHNERMIWDQVAIQASKPKTPQYFLITPKLLPDLKYTPAIQMLCVHNGPFMIDQGLWRTQP